jgi:hypothetical protein
VHLRVQPIHPGSRRRLRSAVCAPRRSIPAARTRPIWIGCRRVTGSAIRPLGFRVQPHPLPHRRTTARLIDPVVWQRSVRSQGSPRSFFFLQDGVR